MTSKQILIVEDEKPIRDMIAFGLRRAGFDVREAEDSSGARASIADHRPDLMLVDWMLPDQSGLELTRAVKRNKDTEDLPVIMLTARADEHDKVSGLEGGADDYVTKPFSPRELLARINAVLRRSAPAGNGGTIEAGGLVLDTREPPGDGRRADRGARARPSIACCSSSWSTPSACTRAARCSIASGAATSMSRSAPWTSTSAACARRWSPSRSDGLIQTVRGLRLPFLDAARVDGRRGGATCRQPAWQTIAWIVATVLVAAAAGFLFDHTAVFVAVGAGAAARLSQRAQPAALRALAA